MLFRRTDIRRKVRNCSKEKGLLIRWPPLFFWWLHQPSKTKQATKQPTNQPNHATNQPTHQPTNHPTHLPFWSKVETVPLKNSVCPQSAPSSRLISTLLQRVRCQTVQKKKGEEWKRIFASFRSLSLSLSILSLSMSLSLFSLSSLSLLFSFLYYLYYFLSLCIIS